MTRDEMKSALEDLERQMQRGSRIAYVGALIAVFATLLGIGGIIGLDIEDGARHADDRKSLANEAGRIRTEVGDDVTAINAATAKRVGAKNVENCQKDQDQAVNDAKLGTLAEMLPHLRMYAMQDDCQLIVVMPTAANPAAVPLIIPNPPASPAPSSGGVPSARSSPSSSSSRSSAPASPSQRSAGSGSARPAPSLPVPPGSGPESSPSPSGSSSSSPPSSPSASPSGPLVCIRLPLVPVGC